MPSYLLIDNSICYYRRRTPAKLNELYPQAVVMYSLGTKCPDEGQRRANEVNDFVEAYWATLLSADAEGSEAISNKLTRLLDLYDYRYQPAIEIAQAPIENIVSRIESVAPHKQRAEHIEAVLGGIETASLTWSEALKLFWQYARPKYIEKSEDEFRKWKYPRERVVKNFIAVNGDIALQETTRQHMLAYRDTLLERVAEEEIKPATVNKEVVAYPKGILKTVNANYRPDLDLDIDGLFQDLSIEGEDGVRPPFSDEHVANVLLDRKAMKCLDDAQFLLVCAMASSGLGLKEVIMRTQPEIHLDTGIPYLSVQGNEFAKNLKTKHRAREIPLVGSSLHAFQQRPNGFTEYRDSPDRVSSEINRLMRVNGLREIEEQGLYSLRHTFQDRLTALDVGDRIQCDLMGHSFKDRSGRPVYGKGPSLEQKYKVLKKIAFEVKL